MRFTVTDILERFKAAFEAGMHVYLLGRIESFDATSQTATVQVLIKDWRRDEDGSEVVESIPAIQGVPVVFPGGGGFRITFPVAAGDFCELHFSDRAIGQWMLKGTEVDPIDRARHALKDAVAHVGIRPSASPWSDVDASVITLGSDGGTAQFAALANLVDARISALVTAINSHTHPSNATPATVDTAGAQATVASATVKIKG